IMLRHPRAEGAERALESAKQNLAQCAAFGVSERFDDSIRLFTRVLNWPGVRWESRNVSQGRPKSDQIEPAVLERIRRETAVDRALYEHGLNLLEKRMSETV
ncbi:MAG: hypothetical protein K8E66_04090, partial [Phycisphaerales bacterium]|nr:hypothetical protein [Phycisphaerales bacterium]